ncbi:SEC-C metal-binding domain-containing protein [Colwellia sp. 20A7]|uniref:SEC-C metal-binding domain-containing protein n=1 Tax=Colwellia sp. 20A7 TaxID=2689569 RepID=UPI00135A2F3C|nr:SEC-C metal-binding domain-containing protein [Colwellia sp. 20A7]
MNNNNQDDINQTIEDNDSCYSKSSCCAPQSPIINTSPKVGRNDLCPCNSGRKFKKCCG